MNLYADILTEAPAAIKILSGSFFTEKDRNDINFDYFGSVFEEDSDVSGLRGSGDTLWVISTGKQIIMPCRSMSDIKRCTSN